MIRKLCAVALALTLVAGCAPGETRSNLVEIPGAYVGRVQGTDTFIAVLLPDAQTGQLKVYACDGQPGRDVTVDQWFTGSLGRDVAGDAERRRPHGDRAARRAVSPVKFVAANGTAAPFTVERAAAGSALVSLDERDPATGELLKGRELIKLGGEFRGAMVSTRASRAASYGDGPERTAAVGECLQLMPISGRAGSGWAAGRRCAGSRPRTG
jgi:hypothetical protein